MIQPHRTQPAPPQPKLGVSRVKAQGPKEINLPALASWREQIPVFDSHGQAANFAQAAKAFNYCNAKDTKKCRGGFQTRPVV